MSTNEKKNEGATSVRKPKSLSTGHSELPMITSHAAPSTVFGSAKRQPITPPSETPGPGQYRLEKAIKQYRHSPIFAFTPSISFGTSLQRPDDKTKVGARSPGAMYDTTPQRCHTAPAFSSRSASPETLRGRSEGRELFGSTRRSATANIGPGSYDLSRSPATSPRRAPRIVFGRSTRAAKDSLSPTLLSVDPSLSSARFTPGPGSYSGPQLMVVDKRGAPRYVRAADPPPPPSTPGFYELPKVDLTMQAAPRALFAKQGSSPESRGSKSPTRSTLISNENTPGPDTYDSLRALNASSTTPMTVSYSMGAGSFLRTDWGKFAPNTPGPGSCLSEDYCRKDIGYIGTKYTSPKAAVFSRSDRFVNPKVHTK